MLLISFARQITDFTCVVDTWSLHFGVLCFHQQTAQDHRHFVCLQFLMPTLYFIPTERIYCTLYKLPKANACVDKEFTKHFYSSYLILLQRHGEKTWGETCVCRHHKEMTSV